MSWKSTTQLLGASYMERVAKQAARTIYDRVTLLKNQQRPAQYVSEVESELLAAAKMDLAEAAKAHAAELAKALDDEERDYLSERERNAEKIELRARQVERAIGGMTTDELRAHATQLTRTLNTGGSVDTDAVDVLAGTLKKAGLHEAHETLREARRAARLDTPWVLTDRGRAIDSELHMAQVAAAQPGVVPVNLQGQWVGASLESIYEDLGGES